MNGTSMRRIPKARSPHARSLHDDLSALEAAERLILITMPDPGGPWLACPHCSAPLVEEIDGTHCGGCQITWWLGLR
jgi:hypothetical protein